MPDILNKPFDYLLIYLLKTSFSIQQEERFMVHPLKNQGSFEILIGENHCSMFISKNSKPPPKRRAITDHLPYGNTLPLLELEKKNYSDYYFNFCANEIHRKIK